MSTLDEKRARLAGLNELVEKLCAAGDLGGAEKASIEARRLAPEVYGHHPDLRDFGPGAAAASALDRAPDQSDTPRRCRPLLHGDEQASSRPLCKNCRERPWDGGELLLCRECDDALLDLHGADR